MKYAVLTNEFVGPIVTRPIVRPTKVYIVEADTPKKAMNAVKKHFDGKPVNVLDAVEAEVLPIGVNVKISPAESNPETTRTVNVTIKKSS